MNLCTPRYLARQEKINTPGRDTAWRTGRDLEREIQQQMIAMIAQVVLFNHAVNARLGLGASDSQFLTLLRTSGPMTPGQLAEASGLHLAQ